MRDVSEAIAGDLHAWQRLVDDGRVWRLDPWFGRMAASLLGSGQLRAP